MDGDDAPQQLVVSREERKYPASWSPGDRILIYNTLNSTRGGSLWALPMGGSPYCLSKTPFQEGLARLSPDGRWLAYVSDETGNNEVYVRPFPGPGEITPISSGGGMEPVWSRSGVELFYRNGQSMMKVDIFPEPKLKVGKPELLFERSYSGGSGYRVGEMYDVSLDAQHFLMIKPVAEAPTTDMKVILNWFEELKRRELIK